MTTLPVPYHVNVRGRNLKSDDDVVVEMKRLGRI